MALFRFKEVGIENNIGLCLGQSSERKAKEENKKELVKKRGRKGRRKKTVISRIQKIQKALERGSSLS